MVIDHAIELNNIGVAAMLVDGGLDLAHQVLKHALDSKLLELSSADDAESFVGGPPLTSTEEATEIASRRVDQARTRLTQLVLKSNSNNSSSNSSSSSNSNSNSPQQHASRERSTLPTRIGASSSSLAKQCQEMCSRAREPVFIYLQPMIIHHNGEEEEPQRVLALDSATLLYNLALVHHSKGVCEQHGMSISRACTFYKMALELVKDVLNEGDRVDLRLIMGILNNLGHIQHTLGDFAASRDMFIHLSRVLVSMCASGDNLFVDGTDWAGLVLNTMIMSDTKTAPAA